MPKLTKPALSVVYALLLSGLLLALALPAVTRAALASGSAGESQDGVVADVVIVPMVELDGDYILLGDVFSPIDRYADRAIARAPDPGEEVTLPAVWLWRTARTFGIDWRPLSTEDTVTVTRPSTTVTEGAITSLIMDEYFMRTGEDDLIDLETDGSLRAIHLPVTASPTARIDRFNLDPRSGRFTATVVSPAEGSPIERMNVSGQFHRLAEMPVPNARLGRDHIIRERDLVMVRLRERSLGTNLVSDPDMLVGMSVQRALSAGEPVRANDIRPPVLVQKNRQVLVTLETQTMILTVQGRALDDGAMGDIIRIQNTESNNVIEAIVTGDARARVELPLSLAMQTN